jgi:GDP-mannose 6-dehydrogenase
MGKGYDLKIYDPDLKERELVGSNLAFVTERLPHLSRLLIDNVSDAGEVSVLVIGKNTDIDRDAFGDAAVLDIDRL